MQEIKAPYSYDPTDRSIVFLSGSIAMGAAAPWQQEVVDALRDMTGLLLNPRRDDWDCVDEQTMAVTKEGLKSYEDLRIGDEILSFDIEKDTLVYDRVRAVNVYPFSGHLLAFKRNQQKFFFTPNHRMVYRLDSRSNRSAIQPAEFLTRWSNCIIRTPAGKILQSSNPAILAGGADLLDDHFRLAAWILSEGSIFTRADCRQVVVTIAQYAHHKANIDAITAILDHLGMCYRLALPNIVLNAESSAFVVGILGLKKYTVPWWVKTASLHEKRVFIEEYGKGDGCIINGRCKYLAFGLKYPDFVREMQLLLYESGLCSTWREKTSGYGQPVVNLSLHNADKQWLCLRYAGEEPYEGTVWCPTTRTGTWIAYRDGSMFVTGNSSWEQSLSDPRFVEQVEWELEGLEKADAVLMHFDPATQSPITLLELGMCAVRADDFPIKVYVSCPVSFWRKGNVDVVCKRYHVPLFSTLDAMVAAFRVDHTFLLGAQALEDLAPS